MVVTPAQEGAMRIFSFAFRYPIAPARINGIPLTIPTSDAVGASTQSRPEASAVL